MIYLDYPIWNNIWKFLYPINDIKNKLLLHGINNTLSKKCYCNICGEYNNITKCEFCLFTMYFKCNNCGHTDGSNLICCVERYEKYGFH